MSDSAFAWVEPSTDEEYKTGIERMFTEMERLNQKIQADQMEIERLKTETRLIQRETEGIKARLQSRLDSLHTLVMV